MPTIDITDASGNVYSYALPEDGSVLLIGADENCSIPLPHVEGLMPQHCTIDLQEEGYVVTVATEGASLLMDGEPVPAAVLAPGAVYQIGSATLAYADEEGAQEEATEEAPKPKKKKKKAKTGNADPFHSTVSYTEEEGVLHIILRRLYVIVILAAAFLAGLTMRYWMITGEFLIDELLK